MKNILLLLLLITSVSYADVMTYKGDIDDKLLETLQQNDVTELIITSRGGYLSSQQKITRHIDNHEITLTVKDYCYSACANLYVMSNTKRQIMKDSELGFHSPMLMMSENRSEYIKQVTRKKYTFDDMRMTYQDAMLFNASLIERLSLFNVPVEKLVAIMRSFGSELVYLSEEEVSKYNIGILIETSIPIISNN